MSGQKFIARNRAPRVQIEYDVELYGAEKKVQLPFVMGVMSDLAGKSEVPQPKIADRKFLEIDVDNFDDRMKSMAPRAAFTVPNTLTGEGNLAVDLTFAKMSDFSPAAIAQNVDSLKPLLDARTQLSNLMTYMDGKAGAEALIEEILGKPELLQSLSSGAGMAAATEATLDALRTAAPPDAPETDTAADVLDGIERVETAPEVDNTAEVLASIEIVEDAPEEDATADVLAGIDIVEDAPEEDATADVLAGIEIVEDAPEEDATADVLAGIDIVEDAPEEDATADVLAGIEIVEDAPEEDATADVLAGIEIVEDAPEEDATADVLASIEIVEDAPEEDATADVLAGIEIVEDAPEEDATADVLASIEIVEDAPEEDATADVLASIEIVEDAPEEVDELGDILAGLDTPEPEVEEVDELGDVLAGLEAPAPEPEEADELGDILAGLDTPTPEAATDDDDLNDILAGLDTPAPDADGGGDLDDILGGLDAPEPAEAAEDSLDDILGGLDTAEEDASADDDLDDILAGLDTPDTPPEDDMDALLAGLDTPEPAPSGDDDLDDILAGLDDDTPTEDAPPADDDMDALLAGLDDDTPEESETMAADTTNAPDTGPTQSPFGTVSVPRPSRDVLNRKKFRMAVFGDFTGRAARGLMETGEGLANRKPIPLDVDTIDEIIEGFGTTLVLPIGEGGTGVEIKLKEMDDLHPDELYDNVELFEAISGVRQQLGVGSMADKAVERLKSWSETYATPIKLPKRSAGSSMPTNMKLTDFQALIGDTRGTLTQAGPADALIAQIIGPHVVKAPDAGAAAMKTAVDEALSSAMNLILHHPEFQAIESQWRSLDLLARRIETDSKLEIVLYDVSAEELAADLAAQEDLSESGLFKLVTDVMDPEEGAGGFSALFGLYTFEETPPHAELLARIGQVGLHVDAPFFSAMAPNYLDVATEDRHPLVAKTWDTLRQTPEAAYVALASPRFLLRQPYGAKSDPVYAFEFEEFSPREGLKGMLWANPVILIAILLAGTYKKDGKAMDLGSMMALGDLPFFYVNDRYGDQVALPCTERNLTSDPAQATLGRGYMPVLWIKGRNEIRLGSFRSLGGATIAGPWEANVPAPRKGPKSANLEVTLQAGGDNDAAADEDTSLDDLLAGLEDDTSTDGDDGDTSLDDLLAGFDDDTDGSDDDEMDPDLAALLEGL
jgi:pilus assembly protein FimV